MKILVTGGTGFIGKHLCAELKQLGHELIVIGRGPIPPNVHPDAVINLAGEPVIGGRWSKEKKKKIYDSRIQITRTAASLKPKVLISASAVGYYGDRNDEELTETSTVGADFLAQVCKDWEAEALKATSHGTRVVTIRIGLVLGNDGGALKQMLPPFKLGLGGPIGSGQQWVSWIHIDDLVSMVIWALENPEVHGPINGVAPNPVRQRDFAKALGRTLKRPAFLAAPTFVLKTALGEASTVLLSSQRVQPEAVEKSGLSFQYPGLPRALDQILK